MQRFLDPEGLRSRGIEHFDAWAATFGEVVDTMEISPDGKTLKPRSRFAKFVNLPELQQMFRAFADVQTAEMLEPAPAHAWKAASRIVVACPMSEEQARAPAGAGRTLRAAPLAEGRSRGRTTPWPSPPTAASWPSTPGCSRPTRRTSPARRSTPWWRTSPPSGSGPPPTRGTQMIFCDMGVNPTPWGYSAYDEIIDKLVARGIPREQIAAIGDADSDAKKQALFEKVRNGQVRVLIGSTQKMGTGTNVQKRLVALHHLDAPWKPAEVEQREGRILRQGNENEEVAIYRYVTEGSFDAYMWQALETKARFIAQVMTGENAVRRAEDIGGQELSYAEVKAIASGNPAVLTLAEADAELQRLAVLKKNHADEQYIARRSLRELPATIDRLTKRVAGLTADMATAAAHADDPITVGDRQYNREDAQDALGHRLDALPDKLHETREFPLGVYRGLAVRHGAASWLRPRGVPGRRRHPPRPAVARSHGPRAILNALERLIDTYGAQAATARQDLAIAESQLRDYQARLGHHSPTKPTWPNSANCATSSRPACPAYTPEPGAEPLPPAHETAERIKALKAAHSIEPAPAAPHRPQPGHGRGAGHDAHPPAQGQRFPFCTGGRA